MILLYRIAGMQPAAADALEALLQARAEEVVLLTDADATETVETLLARRPEPIALTGAAKPDCSPFMLMDMPDTAAKSLIQDMREQGCRIAHKAMVTPNNRGWTLAALVEEIAREDAMMQAIGRLQQFVQASEPFVAQAYPDAAKAAFIAARQEAVALLERLGHATLDLADVEAAADHLNRTVMTMLAEGSTP